MGVFWHHHHFLASSGGTAAAARRPFWRLVRPGRRTRGPRVGMGRKLASADLQLLILGLSGRQAAARVRNQSRPLDEGSKGFYTPSPGMGLPALTHLEEMAHATWRWRVRASVITSPISGAAICRNTNPPPIPCGPQFERVGERMDSLRRAMHAGEQELAPTARATDRNP